MNILLDWQTIVRRDDETICAAIEAALEKRNAEAPVHYQPEKNARNYGCSVEGCIRQAYAKGHCNAHYIRARKGMDLNVRISNRTRNSQCLECSAATTARGGWSLCPRHYKKSRFNVIKDAAIAHFGGKCETCSCQFHRSVFDFHHMDKEEKEDSISWLMANSSPDKISEELSKCILLCANCHRLEHHYEHPSWI
jgi:hypothetical protein